MSSKIVPLRSALVFEQLGHLNILLSALLWSWMSDIRERQGETQAIGFGVRVLDFGETLL